MPSLNTYLLKIDIPNTHLLRVIFASTKFFDREITRQLLGMAKLIT